MPNYSIMYADVFSECTREKMVTEQVVRKLFDLLQAGGADFAMASRLNALCKFASYGK